MRFSLGGLVHVRRAMWDRDNIQRMYSDYVPYLMRYVPLNVVLACDVHTLWMGDCDENFDPQPTEEVPTCLFCVAMAWPE